MRILVTNDDGIDATGLSACVAALAGHEVFVVAPDREQSATSAQLTIRRAIAYRQTSLAGASFAFTCDGSPVDCAKLALGKLLPWHPDLLISGCNEGLNVGYDVFYSGTVAAAMEGIFVGVPSMAVSLARPVSSSVANALRVLPALVAAAAAWSGAGKYLLNVNIPVDTNPPVVITRHGAAAYRYWYESDIKDDAGFCWLRGEYLEGPGHDSDAHNVGAGCVSISLLRPSWCSFPFDARPCIADLCERLVELEKQTK